MLAGSPVAGVAQELPVSRDTVDAACCEGMATGAPVVTLQYLGVGGWLMRRGDAAILTAPMFSNPNVVRVGLWGIEADTALIDRFLPPVADVSAILVGHGHYDHLMDVPYIARRKAPDAVVYGSPTVAHTLAGDTSLPRTRVRTVAEAAGDHQHPGTWVEVAGGRIRFMPLRSAHAPHWTVVTLYHGHRTRDLEELPPTADGWLDGDTYSYLVDFLDESGAVVFRVHYADAVSEAPAGFLPPLAEEDRHPVDVIILAAAGFERVHRYPEDILANTSPRHVLLGHWEDFFRSPAEPPQPLVTLDFDELRPRLEAALPPGAGWTLPAPGAVVRFGPDRERADRPSRAHPARVPSPTRE